MMATGSMKVPGIIIKSCITPTIMMSRTGTAATYPAPSAILADQLILIYTRRSLDSQNSSRIFRFKIFPVGLRGNSSLNSTLLGFL